jgi:hypothetical protein
MTTTIWQLELDPSLFGSPQPKTGTTGYPWPLDPTSPYVISFPFFNIIPTIQLVFTVSQGLFTALPDCLKMSHLRR